MRAYSVDENVPISPVSHLLCLPLEIRQKIIRYIVGDECIHVGYVPPSKRTIEAPSKFESILCVDTPLTRHLIFNMRDISKFQTLNQEIGTFRRKAPFIGTSTIESSSLQIGSLHSNRIQYFILIIN